MDNSSTSLSPLRIPRPPVISHQQLNASSSSPLVGANLSPLSPRQHPNRTESEASGSMASSTTSSVSPRRLAGGGGGGRKHNFYGVTGASGDDAISAQDRRELALLQHAVQQQQGQINTWASSQSQRQSPDGGRAYSGNQTPSDMASSITSNNHLEFNPHVYSNSERQQAITIAKKKQRDEEEQARLLKSHIIEGKVREDQLIQIEEKKKAKLLQQEEEQQKNAMVLERARQERERRKEMSMDSKMKARSVGAEQLNQSEEKRHVESYSKLVEKARDNKWVTENTRLEREIDEQKKNNKKYVSKQDAKLWDEQMKTLEVKSPRTYLSPRARLEKQRAEDAIAIQQAREHITVLDGRRDFEDNVRSTKVDHQSHLIENASKVTAEVVYGVDPSSIRLPEVSPKKGGGQRSPRGFHVRTEVTTKPHQRQAVDRIENAPSYIVKMDDGDRARKDAFKSGKMEADQKYNNDVVSKLLAARLHDRMDGVKVDVYNPQPIDSSASAFHKMGCDEELRSRQRKLNTLRLRQLQELQAEGKRLREKQSKLQERHEDQARLASELDEVEDLKRYLEGMESTTSLNNGGSQHGGDSPSKENASAWMAQRRLYKVAEAGGQYKGGAPAGTRKGGAGFVNTESYRSPLKLQ